VIFVRASAVALMLGAFASGAAGQRPDSGAPRPGGRGGLRGQPPAERQLLQRQVRQAFAKAVKRQLNLSDDQMRRLQSVDFKFERQRIALLRDERQARLGLKIAMDDSANVDQAKVEGYLSQLVKAQRTRADLLESEQKELAGFLNPLQRAKYFSMKERLNRRMQELAQPNGGRGPFEPPPLD
jgi:Spy/CpxP family protein refolding chaperone